MSFSITEITTSSPAWRYARRIRQKVFIDEQDCPPQEEWDGRDSNSRQYLGRANERPVATARWRVVTYDGQPAAKLERIAVVSHARGQGYGRRMVDHLVRAARSAGHDVLLVHAQAHLEEFYASFGFERIGSNFEEAGIPHVKMICTSIAKN